MLKKFHFYRFEFKYLVPERYKDFIREELLPFMRHDDHAQLKKEKKYLVNSLYFDSYDFKSYQEKISGISSRFKLRLRTYGFGGFEKNSEVFFEIKRKKQAIVIKDRGIFTPSCCQHLVRDDNINAVLNSEGIEKQDVLEDFLFLKNKYQMKPNIKITYEREPFEGVYYQNLRITFDSNIQANKADNNYNKILLGNNFVLEVKFRGLLPYWFHRLIQKYQLERVAFSKYCQAVESVI